MIDQLCDTWNVTELETDLPSTVDYPILVEIQIEGNQQVAFVTDLGWASYVRTEVEYLSSAKAHESLVEYFSNLQVVPYMNDAGLQEIADFTKSQFQMETVSNNIADYLNNLAGRAFTYLPMVIGSAIVNLKFTNGIPVNYGSNDADPEHMAAVANVTKLFNVECQLTLDPDADVQFYYDVAEADKKTCNEVRVEIKDITIAGFLNWIVTNQVSLLSKAGNQEELQVVREAILETIGGLVNHLPQPGQTFDVLPHEITTSSDSIALQIKVNFQEAEA